MLKSRIHEARNRIYSRLAETPLAAPERRELTNALSTLAAILKYSNTCKAGF